MRIVETPQQPSRRALSIERTVWVIPHVLGDLGAEQAPTFGWPVEFLRTLIAVPGICYHSWDLMYSCS
jgi:hypothetical protein